MLPRGPAKKVTIYLNEDTRTHVEPLWSAVLNFLRHKQVRGATLLRPEAGFGSHGELHDTRSEYGAKHRPIRIEFIETADRIEDLLPTLYEMVTDGLITSQDVTIIKSVSKDEKPNPAAPESSRKVITNPAKLVRIYLGESDRYQDEPLYQAIVKRLHLKGFAGATVHRGILGYGAKGHTRRGGLFHLSHDLPIMISVIEKPEKLAELVDFISPMLQDGIIVASDVELHQIVHEAPSPRP